MHARRRRAQFFAVSVIAVFRRTRRSHHLHCAHRIKAAAERDVMRQFVVNAKARRFDRIGVIQHVFFRVRRMWFRQIHRHIQHRTGDGLHFVPADRGAESELQLWITRRAFECGYHFGLADAHAPDREWLTCDRMLDLHVGISKAQFVDRRMHGSIATHVRVAKRQHTASFGAAERLQPHRTRRGKQQRLTRHICNCFHLGIRCVFDFRQQILRTLPARHTGQSLGQRLRFRNGSRFFR